ncbi:unnamed protein product [Triticum turgidum subsp. durum]|uniref:Lunapark zinc ribbon domain-containing protein n=1 Tax=Triticum turgidum subsp. durum TaxID=4567 RepID=A0A9R0YPM2_TRITD|nr:unnamed protein product [Triticum turgidum subsp. durum]
MASTPADGAGEPVEAKGKGKEEGEKKKAGGGVLGRMWRGLFGGREDYEKRLQYLSKEEAAVHARMRRRTQFSRRTVRNIIVLSVIAEVAESPNHPALCSFTNLLRLQFGVFEVSLEQHYLRPVIAIFVLNIQQAICAFLIVRSYSQAVAVGYAIMMTRDEDLTWQMRAIRVLPMFVLPAISSVVYSAVVNFTRMLERKDEKTLEKLRAERKAKIDELKERTNYYLTQQLIQKYDLDPAAKAAAASVLASKLGADSGLRVHLGEEPNSDAAVVMSNNAEILPSDGLRNRKQPNARVSRTGSTTAAHTSAQGAESNPALNAGLENVQSTRVVEHYQGSGASDGGWVAKIAALLVGEDPSQSYALICGNCHMHNGLARKEDYPHVTYYCPHCHALNTSKNLMGQYSGSNSGPSTPVAPADVISATSSVVESELINMATVQELPKEEHAEKEVEAS